MILYNASVFRLLSSVCLVMIAENSMINSIFPHNVCEWRVEFESNVLIQRNRLESGFNWDCLKLSIFIFLVYIANACKTLVNYVTLLYLVNATSFNYTQYSYTYQATASTATITFVLRQDPHHWCLDDVSIKLQSNGSNLLANPGFETGNMSDWDTCNPLNATPTTGKVETGCPPYSGNYSFRDGSTGNPDYLQQTVSVASGSYYTVSFWLYNLGSTPTLASVIMSQ
jgi:hypothetical protein